MCALRPSQVRGGSLWLSRLRWVWLENQKKFLGRRSTAGPRTSTSHGP